MDVDLDMANPKTDQVKEESNPLPMQSSSEGSTAKEKEDITQSMERLQIAESSSGFKKKPVIVIVVGMPGSGKTTFLHRLVCHIQASNLRGYVINLDPAVMTLPFDPNIDIRRFIKYNEDMKRFNLGPNEGILRSLNLFATAFDEIVPLIEMMADQYDYVFVDTPGQIEIFASSASGARITEACVSRFPTVIAYVVDTPHSASPGNFMRIMLNGCRILCKTKLPLIIVFNKTDVAQLDFALEWMWDFEVFHEEMEYDHSDTSYSSEFTRSYELYLESFYEVVTSVGVSAVSGDGMDNFLYVVDDITAVEFWKNYWPHHQKSQEEKEEWMRENLDNLRKDMDKTMGIGLKNKMIGMGLMDKMIGMGLMDKEAAMIEDDEDFEMSVREEGWLVQMSNLKRWLGSLSESVSGVRNDEKEREEYCERMEA